MKSQNKNVRYFIYSIILILFFIFNSFAAETGKQTPTYKSRDVFVVIDTSLSMLGIGPTAKRLGMGNISENVKKSALQFVKDLKNGDTFTLATFNTATKITETFEIKSDSDKEKIKKIISNIKFTGLDTYTSLMIREIEKKVKQAEARDFQKNRDRIVIIMSDGLDDPPRTLLDDKLTLREDSRVKRPEGLPLYVYYLHFSPKPITQEQQSRIETIRGGREGQTTVTQADPSHGRQEVIERATEQTRQNVEQDAQRDGSKSKGFLSFLKKNWWWLLIILILLIIAIIFLIPLLFGGKGKSKRPKRYLMGYISYRDTKSNVKEENIFNLSKIKRGYLKIGINRDDDIVLRGMFKFPGIKIYGNKSGGKNGFEISEEDLKNINMIQQKQDGILSYDDIFEIENYSFTLKNKI